MRAARQLAYGEPLVLEDVPRPQAGDGEEVVRVVLAAVNPLDVWVSAGTVGSAGPLPRTGGGEGAGVTSDGRRVAFRGAGLGVVRDGTYAEEVAVPRRSLVSIPEGVTDAQAAGLGVAGVTALACLDLGAVERGTVVLLLGASGGVASLAAQLARARGATVLAQTSSPERVELLRGDADAVVVSDADALEDAVREVAADGVDVVLDGLSGPFTGAAVPLLRPHGRIVLYGASAGSTLTVPSALLYRNGGSILGYGGMLASPGTVAAGLARVLDETAAGRLRPRIADELPLEEVNEAHRRIREREAGGKILLRP